MAKANLVLSSPHRSPTNNLNSMIGVCFGRLKCWSGTAAAAARHYADASRALAFVRPATRAEQMVGGIGPRAAKRCQQKNRSRPPTILATGPGRLHFQKNKQVGGILTSWREWWAV